MDWLTNFFCISLYLCLSLHQPLWDQHLQPTVMQVSELDGSLDTLPLCLQHPVRDWGVAPHIVVLSPHPPHPRLGAAVLCSSYPCSPQGAESTSLLSPEPDHLSRSLFILWPKPVSLLSYLEPQKGSVCLCSCHHPPHPSTLLLPSEW